MPDADAQRSVQRAIFEVQRSLEDIQASLFPDRVLLCDRGTIDGGAYWPDGDGAFFEAMGTTHEAELGRYDAVLFFESAAAAGLAIEAGALGLPVVLDERLREREFGILDRLATPRTLSA